MMPATQPDQSDNITIRRVTLADLDALLHISRQTYFETFFEAFNDPDGYEAYTAEVFAPERLTAEIADPDTAFYFATDQNSVIGYIKLSYKAAQTVFQGYDAVEIERIYVLAGHQNKQIGKALLAYAIALAQHNEMKCLWLGVWEENTRAIRFYERHGLARFDTHYYMVGADRQMDFLMKLML